MCLGLKLLPTCSMSTTENAHPTSVGWAFPHLIYRVLHSLGGRALVLANGMSLIDRLKIGGVNAL
jgi:hypothetical protein